MAEIGTVSIKLSSVQRRAILALLSTKSVSEAAQAVKVGERTLWRWLGEPLFRAYLASAEGDMIDAATRRLLQLQEGALEAIEAILHDEEASAGVRLRAAEAVLDHLHVFNAFRINDDIGLYLKYAGNPRSPYGEYQFSFRSDNLDDLDYIRALVEKTFVALVCVTAREIWCLQMEQFDDLIQRRALAVGNREEQYQILATAPKGMSFRVIVNAPGTKGRILGERLVVARNAFPGMLFQ